MAIVTPLHQGPSRLADLLADTRDSAADQYRNVRVLSVRSLSWLASTVSAGRLSPDDVVGLFTASADADFVIELMQQTAAQPVPLAPAPSTTVQPSGVRSEPAYWVAAIEPAEWAVPEKVVETMIRKRQILALRDLRPGEVVQAGDWMEFLVNGETGNAVAGHGQVASIVDGAGLVRDSDTAKAVVQLKDVEIYDAPKPVTFEMPSGRALWSISREEFTATTDRPRAGNLRLTVRN
jgi:hypothetical protein